MKNLLILVIALLLSVSASAKRYADPVDVFKKETRFLGKKNVIIEKLASKYAKKFNGNARSYDSFNNIKIIEVSWTTKAGNYHKHKWYFKGGPFCEGYEYITTYDAHYKLLRSSFESASNEYYGNDDIKITRKRLIHNIFDISTVETYYSPKNKIYIGFGAKQINNAKNQYKIEIYR